MCNSSPMATKSSLTLMYWEQLLHQTCPTKRQWKTVDVYFSYKVNSETTSNTDRIIHTFWAERLPNWGALAEIPFYSGYSTKDGTKSQMWWYEKRRDHWQHQ